MSSLKTILKHALRDGERAFDRLKYRLIYALWGPDPIKIVAYRGFGTRERIHLSGRVLEDQGVRAATDENSVWRNLLDTYKRMASDEVPHARLLAQFRGQQQEVLCDAEGHFDFDFVPTVLLPDDDIWHEVDLELIHPLPSGKEWQGPITTTAQVLVPTPRASFGVISDIDDTVIKTDATNLLRMARTTFLNNARTRLPFAGAAAFYRALHAGGATGGPNPLFFVSNGPWNLYDLLEHYLRLQGFPPGVPFLRNWGVTEEGRVVPLARPRHKPRAIRRLLETYHDLPFILVGDSGEEDPEIYHTIVREFPDRILAVYIRNVSRKPERADAIRALADETVGAGSDLVLSATSLGMAEHAAEHGWIDPSALAEIRREKDEDEAEPGPLEKLLGADEPAGEEGPTVRVDEEDAEGTRQAVREGAIEEALQEGDPERQEAPDVRVESEGADRDRPEQREDRDRDG
ncbi:MAG: phosphatase domain-containing protein [Candidatus Krumholzibacteriia bacterium]